MEFSRCGRIDHVHFSNRYFKISFNYTHWCLYVHLAQLPLPYHMRHTQRYRMLIFYFLFRSLFTPHLFSLPRLTISFFLTLCISPPSPTLSSSSPSSLCSFATIITHYPWMVRISGERHFFNRISCVDKAKTERKMKKLLPKIEIFHDSKKKWSCYEWCYDVFEILWNLLSLCIIQ